VLEVWFKRAGSVWSYRALPPAVFVAAALLLVVGFVGGYWTHVWVSPPAYMCVEDHPKEQPDVSPLP